MLQNQDIVQQLSFFLALPGSKMWSIQTSHSKMFKLITVRKDMTSNEFMEKISKLYNIKMGYFSVGYSLPQNPELQVELDMDDSEGFGNAYCLLPSFSKLKVVMKTQISGNISIAMGKRTVRNKEIVSEEIKREMGLYDEEGKRKRGCVNAHWTAKCWELIETDPRFLMEFDKVQSGIEKTWGSKSFLLNPFQAVRPICGEICVLSKMNQPQEMMTHIKEKHFNVKPASEIAIKRLQAWKENNFITVAQLNDVTPLAPGLFKDPVSVTENPMVRAAVLARGIDEGAV